MCREAVDSRGMSSLVAKSGEEACAQMVAELEGEKDPKQFDPLISLNWHFSGEAIRCGGLYLMSPDPSGANDGHWCPICEFVKNAKGFDAKAQIGRVADQMAEHAREQGLIPKVQ